MTIRLRWTAFVFVACLASAILAERRNVPITQVDLYAANDVRPALAKVRPDDAVRSVLTELSTGRQVAFAEPPAGAALAGDDPLARALETVNLAAIASDRLRIRIASDDLVAARAVGESLRRSLLAAGLDERFSLFSHSTGSPLPLILWLMTALAASLLLIRGGRETVRWARPQRRPAVMRGAASTG